MTKENHQRIKNGLLETFYFRKISILFSRPLSKTRITPNQISLFSLFLSLIAAGFFLLGDYKYIVIGSLFLNIAYIFDCVDGEVARLKNAQSRLGDWFDSVLDRITYFSIFVAITLGIYFTTKNPIVLILGLFAVPSVMMIGFLSAFRGLTSELIKKSVLELNKKTFIGGGEMMVLLVTLGALINRLYYVLLIYAILGPLIWIAQIITRYKTMKDE